MSSVATIPEDYIFFDFLAPLRWPEATSEQIAFYRQLVDHGDLHIETMLENALVVQSQGLYTRTAGINDFSGNWGDAKKSISAWRMNNKKMGCWTNSCIVTNVKNKQGMLRCLLWSRYSQRFYFLAVPEVWHRAVKSVELSMDTAVGEPWRDGEPQPPAPIVPKGLPRGKWSKFLVDDFKTLATITEQAMLEKVGYPNER